MKKPIHQTDQVIQVMKDCGGFATFGQLYKKVDFTDWKTKTPQASIRRIVQNTNYFFKIEPGLWSLISHRSKLPKHISSKSVLKNKTKSEHYYYQGLLVEIGNLQNYGTFVPNQDKNKKFLNTNLGKMRTLHSMPEFSYPEFIKQAQTVDVSWFSSRKMPRCFFEVEHSTQMERALVKFSELSDFNAGFYIVSDKSREREFEEKKRLKTFESIENRVEFLDYEKVSRWHSLQTMEPNSSLFQNNLRTLR